MELATVYAALGARVTVVELTEGLLPGCDRDLVKPLETRMAGRYEAILTGTRVVSAQAREDGVHVIFEGANAAGPQVYDAVLVAVGRRPNGAGIGAERAGVQVDERGFIAVDAKQRTNVPHIFAIGDVVGEPMLAHKAAYEGKVAAEVAAGRKAGNDAKVIPAVAYTDPEVAWVGLTETAARRDGVAYESASFPWAASGRALSLGRGEGLTKILVDPRTHALLGVGMVGPQAGDLIAEAALAIEMGAEPGDIALTIHPHPTLSETLAFAAEAYEGTLTELYLNGKKS
jgi:dihydrolipoamide dehydrogenase